MKVITLLCAMVAYMGACSGPVPPPGKNRLTFEHSPYLQQHADNPVDWYPWGDEAFQKAQSEHKLVFLSIGYSTCHWCHVMAHESFENASIAKILNENFVSIKVDREERPDVDRVYMDTVVAMTGHGGWPLSVFLTPERKPIFGGTYFRPEPFQQLLQQLTQGWKTEPTKFLQAADQVIQAFQKQTELASPLKTADIKTSLKTAVTQLEQSFDKQNGGFGQQTKFPQESRLLLILRLMAWQKFRPKLEPILTKTLDEMLSGGLTDHIGGGFHRYCVDPEWTVPHFEKMLYNQALMARVLLETYQVTKSERYLLAARETLDYVLEKLMSSTGGFLSAQDADTAGQEGTTYVWVASELRTQLSPKEFQAFEKYFAFTEAGNFEHHTNVLRFKDVTQWHQKTQDTHLKSALQTLKTLREKRAQPATDTKVITDWNGLMISALALGFRLTQNPQYLAAAQKAASFIQTHLYKQGKLLRRAVGTHINHEGVHSDYAYLIAGLLDLAQADFNVAWLDWAKNLQIMQDTLFWDEKQGGYFYTARGDELPFPPTKEFEDSALLSPNGVSVSNLLKLYQFFLDHRFKDRAQKTLASVGQPLTQSPSAFATLTESAVFDWQGGHALAIIGPAQPMTEWLTRLNQSLLPHLVIAHSSAPTSALPLLKDRPLRNTQTTFYICQAGSCQLPTNDPTIAWQQIHDTAKLPPL